MEFVYFAITGIALYVFSDRLLDRIEVARGERFENRQMIFFAILLVLAVASFALIQSLTGA